MGMELAYGGEGGWSEGKSGEDMEKGRDGAEVGKGRGRRSGRRARAREKKGCQGLENITNRSSRRYFLSIVDK